MSLKQEKIFWCENMRVTGGQSTGILPQNQVNEFYRVRYSRSESRPMAQAKNDPIRCSHRSVSSLKADPEFGLD